VSVSQVCNVGGEPATVHRFSDDTWWCDEHADAALVCAAPHEHVTPPVAEVLVTTFSSLWQYETNPTMAKPDDRHYRTNTYDLAPVELAFSVIDDDIVNRHDFLVTLASGDHIAIRSTQTQGDWSEVVVTDAVTDHTTWVLVPIAYVRQGGAGAVPGGNSRMLFDFMRVA